MGPLTLDSRQNQSELMMLAGLIFAAAIIAGFATAMAIDSRAASEDEFQFTSLAVMGQGEAPPALGDYETASAEPMAEIGAPPAAELQPNVFALWNGGGAGLSAKEWMRTQLVRLPDGAAAHLNSRSGTTWVVELVETYRSDDGRTCRDYWVSAELPTGPVKRFDAACRLPGGTWHSQYLGAF